MKVITETVTYPTHYGYRTLTPVRAAEGAIGSMAFSQVCTATLGRAEEHAVTRVKTLVFRALRFP